jgi:hypothetical protein
MTYVNLVAIIGAGVSVAGGLVAVISTIAGWNFRLSRVKQEAELLSLLPESSQFKSALSERVDRLTEKYLTSANKQRFIPQELVAAIVMFLAAIFNIAIASSVSGLDWCWGFAGAFGTLGTVTLFHSIFSDSRCTI